MSSAKRVPEVVDISVELVDLIEVMVVELLVMEAVLFDVEHFRVVDKVFEFLAEVVEAFEVEDERQRRLFQQIALLRVLLRIAFLAEVLVLSLEMIDFEVLVQAFV